MKSRLYECHVMHARFLPKPHRFVYRIFMLAVDLDELPALDRKLRLFSLNRPGLYSFREPDFLPTAEPLHNAFADTTRPAPAPKSATLKTRVLAYLAERGVDLGPGGRIELVTLPRVLGYLFNPVSFYFCYDRTGACVASIAEVTNTFREMKPYFLGPETGQKSEIRSQTSAINSPSPPSDLSALNSRLSTTAGASGTAVFQLRTPKNFYVSPYSDVDVDFDFHLRAPAGKLAIQIDDYVDRKRTLTSTLTGPARPLTDATLAWFTFKYPFITLQVIAFIHWHALRLYLKKIPWFAKAARPADQRDLYRPHASITHPSSHDA